MKVETKYYNGIYTQYAISTKRGNTLNIVLPTGARIDGARVRGKRFYLDIYTGWLRPMYAKTVTATFPRTSRLIMEQDGVIVYV